MKRQTKVLLGAAIFMQICSYFLPFMTNRSGYDFFAEGVSTLFDKGIRTYNWYMFYAFFTPLLSVPILLIGLFKSLNSFRMKVFKMGLFISLLIPVLLSVVLALSETSFFGISFLGYSCWVVSLCLMYGVIFFKKEVKENGNIDDLSNHLIEDET
jgi:hypothetical protein